VLCDMEELYKQAEKDYLNGMKYKEIAEKYDVSINTVKSWKQRYKWNRKGMHTKEKSMHTKKDTISWVNIENEYVTDIRRKPCTLEDLSNKHKISFSRLSKYASENDWSDKRKNYAKTVQEKHIEKTAELISDDLSQVTARHFRVSDKLLSAIEKALNDEDELYKYVEKLRQGYGKGSFTESIEVERIDALNEGKVLNLANSLEKLQKMQRQSLDIVDAKDRHKMDMDKRKLGDDDEEYEDDGFLEALDGKEVNWDEEA
jgi:phage terminase small subunit